MLEFFVEASLELLFLSQKEPEGFIELLQNPGFYILDALENLVEFQLQFCPVARNFVADFCLFYPELLQLVFGQLVMSLNFVEEVFQVLEYESISKTLVWDSELTVDTS